MQSLGAGTRSEWRTGRANGRRTEVTAAGELRGGSAQRIRRSLEEMVLEQVLEVEPAPPGRHHAWVARTADTKFFVYSSRADAAALARRWQREESTRQLCEGCVDANGRIDLGRMFAVDGREIRLVGGAVAYMVGTRRTIDHAPASGNTACRVPTREEPLACPPAPVPGSRMRLHAPVHGARLGQLLPFRSARLEAPA
jgi:hypothetical protein